MAPEKYPWYDGRRPPYKNPWADDDDPAANYAPGNYAPGAEAQQSPAPKKPETPREIFTFLNRHIHKQEEAKKCAAMVMYNALHGHAEHAFFIGPSGCGKTAIWRALQEIYPDMIQIFDGSRITMEGWKGDYKIADLLKSDIVLRQSGNVIYVIDEADKTFSTRIALGGENVGQSIAGEFLKLMDGIVLPSVSNKTTYYVDTSRISIVFCGAFSKTANEIAEKNSRKQIGFGSVKQDAKPYDREITTEDLIAHGVLPELIGRISRVVNLAPMTSDDYFEMLDEDCSPTVRLEQQYGVNISLLPETRKTLAEAAAKSGLGVRAVESALRRKLDEALFNDCSQASFEF